MLRYYQDESDFRWLWSRDGVAELLDPRPSHLLHICWDGFPDGIDLPKLPLSPHLTPFDWVVSFARRVSRKTTLPDLRIVISRPWIGGAIMEREGCFGPLLTKAVERAFPWLRTFDRPEEVPVTFDGWPSLRTAPPWKGAAEALAQGWVGNLARSVSHHDVNNALGPHLLLKGLGQSPPPHVGLNALLQHAQRLGLAPTGEIASRASAARPAAVAREIVGRLGGTLRIVLIDDQINNGWAKVVAALLGLTLRQERVASDTIQRLSEVGPVELWGAERVDPLFEILEKSGYSDGRFRLRLTDDDADGRGCISEILLLDLRLGFEEDRDKGVAKSALTRAAKAAKAYDNSGLSERVWGTPLMPQASLEEDLLEEGQQQLELLTLPARTLATADIGLPIIIFSSTAQRTVVESLKPYRNVSTHFEKPQVLGYRATHVSNDAALRFADVLADAATVLEGRRTVAWLGEPAPLAPAHPSEKDELSIDVFIDETGKEPNRVTLAALVVVQAPRQAYRYAYDDEAQQIVRAAFREAGENSKKAKEMLKRDSRVSEILKRLDCSLVALSFQGRDFERTSSVDDPFFSDFLYREITSDLLEYILYHHAPELACGRAISARVHLATRVRPANPAECHMEDEYWGRNSNEDQSTKKWRIYLISPNDCLPIVQRVSSYYPNSGVKITRARCFHVNDLGDERNLGLHYLADTVANRSFLQNERLIQKGAYGQMTPAVRSLLHAVRDARNGDIAGALGRANALVSDIEKTLCTPDGIPHYHLVSRLKSRLAGLAAAMSGAQFSQAFEQMRL